MYLPIYVRIFIKKASYHIYYRLKMSKSNRFLIVHVMVAASLNQLCNRTFLGDSFMYFIQVQLSVDRAIDASELKLSLL